jgi:hypothetical protein
LASEAARQAIYALGRDRAAAIVAATVDEIAIVAVPLDIILP